MRKEKWIIEAYRMADDQGKLDMYMTCRDHREEFDEIEAASSTRNRKVEPQIVSKPAREKWTAADG